MALKIGWSAVIIAPEKLATEAWVRQSTRLCRGWTLHHLNRDTLDKPIELLALADELWVIADEKTSETGFDLRLSEGAEDLLWLALALEVEAKYFHIDATQLRNPETSLQRRGSPERAAVRQSQRVTFTRQLKELRLDTDYSSSGLWSEEGRMLGYDLLDLPFPLVRRIAVWQRNFDETVAPSGEGSEESAGWRERHAQEQIEIAIVLEATLGSVVAVKIYRAGGWVSIDQISRAEDPDKA